MQTIVVLGLIDVVLVWVVGFNLWKRMRLDYEEDKILELVAVIGLAGFVMGVITNLIIYRRWSLWPVGVVFGVLGGLVWYCKRRKWDMWEWIDTLGPILLLINIVTNKIWVVWGGVGLLVTIWAGKSYRKISWYKSGKMGFVGLVCLMWWSAGEILVATLARNGIYWLGLTLEQWTSVLILTVSTIVLIIRGRIDDGSDWKAIWRRRKKRLQP